MYTQFNDTIIDKNGKTKNVLIVVHEYTPEYPPRWGRDYFIEPGCRFAGYIYGENGMVTEYVTEEEDEFRYMAIEKFGYDPELFEKDCC